MSARAATARVLTVEDDPIVRADLRLILEDAGFDVCADARDGIEAVDLAREHAPDLILIDLGLPRLDGVEATRQILRESDVPIVTLSGQDADVVDRASEAGASAHVAKPFSVGQLVGTVRSVLAAHAESVEWNAEGRHLMPWIESMLQEGYSQREIEHAVRRATGSPAPRRGVFRGLLGLVQAA
jgi:response regulator NasT